MYVMHSVRHDGILGNRSWVTQTLHEVTRRDYEALCRSAEQAEWYPVSAQGAHRHVRQGGCHTTLLYLDEGRIRRAG